jgi:hypothetical protein
VSFFESVPEPPERDGNPARLRPDGVMPGVAPAPLSLIRTDEVAVAISGVRAYPNGFEFTVHARMHREDLPWGLPPTDSIADPRTRQSPEKALRLGVLYADGHRARTPSDSPAGPAEDAGREYVTFLEVSRSGTGRQWDGDFWVHPLPPDGPVTFVASWLLYGVTETRAELDSRPIHEAARRAVTIWPDEPAPGEPAGKPHDG